MKQELGITEKEAKNNLDKDSQHELKQLVKKWKEENSELEDINQKIKEETAESEKIIKIDEKLVAEVEEIKQDIDQLTEILSQYQNTDKPIQTLRIYRTLLNDLPNASQKLGNIIDTEKTETEELGEKVSHATQNTKKIMENSEITTEQVQEQGFNALQIIGAIIMIVLTLRFTLSLF